MNSFKVFVIPYKIAILPSYFVFFLLRSAAMPARRSGGQCKNPSRWLLGSYRDFI